MSLLSAFRVASTPAVAVEIASHHVSAAVLDRRSGEAVVSAHASEPLPAGALVPSLTALNAHDRAGIVGALGRVLDQVGGRPRRLALVVPDPVARVSIVHFEKVPARRQDLDQLVRWQVRKAAPFPIEDAQVSYVPGMRTADGQDFVVTLARRDIVEEYEGLCAELGAHAGIVDLATLNVLNAVLAGGRAQGFAGRDNSPASTIDWLLVNVTPDSASLAITRGENLIFFRNRSEAEGTLAELVHQTAMYYEDRLSGHGFGRVLLAGASGAGGRQAAVDAEHLRRNLEERLDTKVETVDPRIAARVADRITAAPALLDTLAPLVGMLLREAAA